MLIISVSELFNHIKWYFDKSFIVYGGYHCGLCGKYIHESFLIPVDKSNGHYLDTWGICSICEDIDDE